MTTPRVVLALMVGAALVALSGCAAPAPDTTPVDLRASPTAARDRLLQQSRASDRVITALAPADQPGCSAAVAVAPLPICHLLRPGTNLASVGTHIGFYARTTLPWAWISLHLTSCP